MSLHVSDLTIEEFKLLIRQTVAETLSELLSDPDEGLVLRDSVQTALRHSLKSIKEGKPTYSAEEAASRLGLDL